jgi:hypothetical protein
MVSMQCCTLAGAADRLVSVQALSIVLQRFFAWMNSQESIISNWLFPRLCDALVGDLNRALLNRLLIEPMAAEHCDVKRHLEGLEAVAVVERIEHLRLSRTSSKRLGLTTI